MYIYVQIIDVRFIRFAANRYTARIVLASKDAMSSGGVWKAMDAEKSGGRPSWFFVNEIHAHD